MLWSSVAGELVPLAEGAEVVLPGTVRGPAGNNESNPRPSAFRLSTGFSASADVVVIKNVPFRAPNSRTHAKPAWRQPPRLSPVPDCHPERSEAKPNEVEGS